FGNVVIPRYEHEIKEAIQSLIDTDIDSSVISLLNSYTYTEHERKIRDIAKRMINEQGRKNKVYANVDYNTIRNETHRNNTTIVEAYAAEPSRETLAKLDKNLKENGTDFNLRIMASHGGTISIEANELARTCVSGPIGGMVGAKYLSDNL